MQTGENQESLRKLTDLFRLGSIGLLLHHFYMQTYLKQQWVKDHLPVLDRIMSYIAANEWLNESYKQKLAVLLLLGLSILGVRGKKDQNIQLRPLLWQTGIALLFYMLAGHWIHATLLYILTVSASLLVILSASIKISRWIGSPMEKDIFNELNESFPQEERKLENPFSINLPARYALQGQWRQSWINIINPFRGTIVMGTPGSGKSYFVIRHIITQHIEKGFTMFLYDFKFPDLSRIAYHHLKKNLAAYEVPPKMYFLNFDDLTRTHRCNVLYPDQLLDITDATECSRTILLALNREWIKKTGDFFVESPINFTTAIFWYLKKYEGGKYCTLPHAIELAQVSYDKLFPVLSLEPDIEALINPFVSAYLNKANEQLEGQIASAKIGLARLVSPSIYYVLSGNDVTLDVNNPLHPKIICAGNNPAKQQTYGAVQSLYIERMLKLVNRKGQLKCSLPFDEAATVFLMNIDTLIATARSNKVATTLGLQDISQLTKDYGKEQAQVIVNVCGNIISGQVMGDSAKQLSDRIGKIMQDRKSVSINSSDTSISHSHQLETAIPASRIANLSSGEFVGAVSDEPGTKIKYKAFHAEILNDHEGLAAEEKAYDEIPVIRQITQEEVMDNFRKIKEEVKELITTELLRIETIAGSGKILQLDKHQQKHQVGDH